MFLMERLVSRSSRSLAVMVAAAISARGRTRDYLRGGPRALLHPLPVMLPFAAHRSSRIPLSFHLSFHFSSE
jgi:hypothetical protein